MTCGFQDIMIYRYFKCKFINSEMKLLHQNFKNPERCIPCNDFPSNYWSVVHVYFFSGT